MIYYGKVIFLIFLTHSYSRFYSFTFPIISLISPFFFFLFISLTCIIDLFCLPGDSCSSVISLSFQMYFRYQKLLLFFFLLLPSFTNLTSFIKSFTYLFFHISLFLLLTFYFLLLAIGWGLVPPISLPMRGSPTRRRVSVKP